VGLKVWGRHGEAHQSIKVAGSAAKVLHAGVGHGSSLQGLQTAQHTSKNVHCQNTSLFQNVALLVAVCPAVLLCDSKPTYHMALAVIAVGVCWRFHMHQFRVSRHDILYRLLHAKPNGG
jgi:hypothetical protein